MLNRKSALYQNLSAEAAIEVLELLLEHAEDVAKGLENEMKILESEVRMLERQVGTLETYRDEVRPRLRELNILRVALFAHPGYCGVDHYLRQGRKLEAIKQIRSLTQGTLGLKEALALANARKVYLEAISNGGK